MNQQTINATQRTTASGMIEQLIRYDGPPEIFLQQLLALQCNLASATGAVVIRLGGNQQADVVSVFPPLKKEETPPLWLSQAVDAAVKSGGSDRTEVFPIHQTQGLYGQPADQHMIMMPIKGMFGGKAMAAYKVQRSDSHSLQHSSQWLEVTAYLLGMYEMRLAFQRQRLDMQRLKHAQEILAAVNQHKRAKAAAMALCHEVTARWDAERVGFGLLSGRYVKLKSLSHTEKFSRKMKLVQDIESAMEECLDQDCEVIYPAAETADYVYRASDTLSTQHGPVAICVLPLRYENKVVGAVSIERAVDKPFALKEVETLRLTCELCTARLVDLDKQDRLFFFRWADAARHGLSFAVGPKHTWVKVAALAVIGIALFLTFVQGTYRVEAPFIIEPIHKRVVSTPFAGYLIEAPVLPGDKVQINQLLARLDVTDKEDQLLQALAEHRANLREADIALRDGKMAEAQIANAKAEAVTAKIDLLRVHVKRSRVISPIQGIVLTGDWSQKIGKEVQMGELLFEVAPEGEMRAVLHVPEGMIADVTVGQVGQLASASYPGQYVNFEVQRIDPVAQVVDQQNIFKVRVKLLSTDEADAIPPFKPGVEGLAKIDVEPRTFAKIWSKRLIDWLRMKLWI